MYLGTPFGNGAFVFDKQSTSMRVLRLWSWFLPASEYNISNDRQMLNDITLMDDGR